LSEKSLLKKIQIHLTYQVSRWGLVFVGS